MPMVQAKCTNCGANLKVDDTKAAAFCPYCGASYIVEKAINNYNVSNNIHAGIVNIFGGESAEFVIRAGKLEKYNGAAVDVIIPNNVTIIGDGVFKNCLGLRSVIIPNSVTSIGDEAFSGCENLISVDMPKSISRIGNFAFFVCRNLSSITLNEGINYIGENAFSGCSSLKSVVLPKSITRIYNYTFSNCTSLAYLFLPDSLTAIHEYAFLDCENLQDINIPYSVSLLSPNAFLGCNKLRDKYWYQRWYEAHNKTSINVQNRNKKWNKKTIILIIVGIVLIGVIGCIYASIKLKDDLNRAKDYIAKSEYSQAKIVLDSQLKTNPTFSQIYEVYADYYLAQNDYLSAIDILDIGIKKCSKNNSLVAKKDEIQKKYTSQSDSKTQLSEQTVSSEITQSNKSFSFVLYDGDVGEYGKEFVLNEGTEYEEHEIAYYVPNGKYLVKNNDNRAVQVSVCKGGPEYDGEWQYFTTDEDCAKPIVLLEGETKELEIKEGQFVVLSDGSNNILFCFQ